MKLQSILEKTIPGLGFELVDFELSHTKLIRVYIDKENGVNIDDCALVSNHLTRVFMVEGIEYNRLEVSSPGLERPLKKLEDFIRFKGCLAKIKMQELIAQNKVFIGTLGGVIEDKIILNTSEGKVITLEFNKITRAKLLFEPKKGIR